MNRLNPALTALALAAGATLAGCSSVENFLSGDKVDYRASARKTTPLEIPPDLTQLQREGRYQPQASSVSASSFQAAAASAPSSGTPNATVAPQSLGDAHIERDASQRWLVTSQTPEQLWPQLRAFWIERGFTLVVDQPEVGVMETDWAENRAKIPQDFIRRTIGRVFDGLYDTGQRDKFRTRVERTPNGSEVYISHRGMEETVTGAQRDQTIWQPRPTDPQLEGEFLSRLMAKLAPPKESALAQAPGAASAPAAAPTAPAAPPRAHMLAGSSSALQVDEGFDRAWRRVGLALDRSGFTVEDRDRKGGLYFVRYVDPKLAGKEEPNFFERLFSSDKSGADKTLSRYRIALKGEGDKTTVSVLNAQGTPETGDIGQRIAAVLLDELK